MYHYYEGNSSCQKQPEQPATRQPHSFGNQTKIQAGHDQKNQDKNEFKKEHGSLQVVDKAPKKRNEKNDWKEARVLSLCGDQE